MQDPSTGGVRDGPATPYEPRPQAASPHAYRTHGRELAGLVGQSPAMQQLRRDIRRYAPTTAPVVICGETGTGKELVARALHLLSPRAKGPFVAVSLAEFSESLVGSALFGHERGAFTGAIARHRGVFEQADGGTLFLDEFVDVPHDVQVRLLRSLETMEVRPVGSERSRRVNVRLVVAVHTDLGELVREGLLRQDLFFRLHTLALTTPALRHRPGDLPELVRHLVLRLEPEVGKRRVLPDGIQLLTEYGWPGNVRQLLAVLRRAAICSDAVELGAPDLAAALQLEPSAREEITDGAIAAMTVEALRRTRGRVAPAAKLLGVARSTVRARIKRYRIVLPNDG